jgi:hypothetical protein
MPLRQHAYLYPRGTVGAIPLSIGIDVGQASGELSCRQLPLLYTTPPHVIQM